MTKLLRLPAKGTGSELHAEDILIYGKYALFGSPWGDNLRFSPYMGKFTHIQTIIENFINQFEKICEHLICSNRTKYRCVQFINCGFYSYKKEIKEDLKFYLFKIDHVKNLCAQEDSAIEYIDDFITEKLLPVLERNGITFNLTVEQLTPAWNIAIKNAKNKKFERSKSSQ